MIYLLYLLLIISGNNLFTDIVDSGLKLSNPDSSTLSSKDNNIEIINTTDENKSENAYNIQKQNNIDDTDMSNFERDALKKFNTKSNKIKINADSVYINQNAMQYNITVTISDLKDNPKYKYNTMIQTAYDAFNQGSFEVTIALCKNILVKDKNNYDILFILGVTYQKLNQIDKAIDVYEKMLKLKPNDIKVTNNLLIALSNQDLEIALRKLLIIFRIAPINDLIIAQIGTIYIKLNDYNSAIGYLSKAAELTSDNTIYLYNLAIAYDKLKQYDYALYYYEFILQNRSILIADGIDIKNIQTRIDFIKQHFIKETKKDINKSDN